MSFGIYGNRQSNIRELMSEGSMDDLQQVLIDILVAGGKAIAESSAADGAKLIYEKLKDVLRGKHGVDAVTRLDSRQPSQAVLAELGQQLKAAPAAIESADVRRLMLELTDAVPALVDLDNVAAARKLLIRNVQGAVRIRNSSAGDDLTIEGITRGHPQGN
jgi:hypothetical protein